MKHIVKHIDEFLKSKNIEWVDRQIYDFVDERYVEAKDNDFDINGMQLVTLKDNSGKISLNKIWVYGNMFIVFNSLGNKMTDNFSAEWKYYLEDKKQLEEKFNSFKQDFEASDFDDLTK